MGKNLEDALLLAERVLMHVRHSVPPEVEVMNRLETLIGEVRKEHGIPPPIAKSLPGRT